jgi:ABC-type lipopolysaccharide export system ATPase subunit
MASITLEGLVKRFGALTVVDRISLDIEDGEFFTLLGPSGCGKTTLLRMLAGFVAPDEGDIRFAGKSIVAVPPYRRETGAEGHLRQAGSPRDVSIRALRTPLQPNSWATASCSTSPPNPQGSRGMADDARAQRCSSRQ